MNEFGDSLDEQAKLTNPSVWTRESFNEARSNAVYGPLFDSNVVTQDYVNKAYALCRKKVVLGGLRLANILKEIYLTGKSHHDVETDKVSIKESIFEMIKDDQTFEFLKPRRRVRHL